MFCEIVILWLRWSLLYIFLAELIMRITFISLACSRFSPPPLKLNSWDQSTFWPPRRIFTALICLGSRTNEGRVTLGSRVMTLSDLSWHVVKTLMSSCCVTRLLMMRLPEMVIFKQETNSSFIEKEISSYFIQLFIFIYNNSNSHNRTPTPISMFIFFINWRQEHKNDLDMPSFKYG